MQTEESIASVLARGRQALTQAEKIETIRHHFREIMLALGLDLEDDSLKDTPARVAKMFVNEAFSGLDPASESAVTLFENNLAVIIKAEHLCVASRGVNHTGCATVTSSYHGQFLTGPRSRELHALLAV
ncbi:GTP cyclohydrolase I [Chitinophaga sp. NPDC101104]|uniref:GTP cyclohydrolase I n=1 Tax=Chitinophaga sp. NPDC101104 TaxID=3390561 RepID=UPI003D010179